MEEREERKERREQLEGRGITGTESEGEKGRDKRSGEWRKEEGRRKNG